MPDPVRIRPLAPGDLEHLFARCELHQGRAWLARQRAGRALMLIAAGPDRPLARCGLDLPADAGGSAYLSAARTAVGHRGRGLGAALIGAVEAEAARQGAAAISLDVAADNPRAEELYRRLGYRRAGRRQTVREEIHGPGLVVIRKTSFVMVKALPPR